MREAAAFSRSATLFPEGTAYGTGSDRGPPGQQVERHCARPIHADSRRQYARRRTRRGPGMLSAPDSYRMRRLISRAVMTAR